ncbi:hypothetical protein PR003_g23755 [Phytophthora rubi]|uniref:Uncharacterized protein n=1 Tax=Phytophthora rubi TaxID=129364 RepID=A0A6A4CZ76_9STRA|nr:hypothetical protein PR002_g22540 [Phytophthora rubi]KAE9296443.1 hypothetical protein PR003_g23755 [Phytophthora rubi]
MEELLLGELRALQGRPVASFFEDDTVDDIWSFMLPWCDHVRGAVGYWEGESSDPLFQSYHGLKIHSPRKTSVSQSDEEADEQINSQRFHL